MRASLASSDGASAVERIFGAMATEGRAVARRRLEGRGRAAADWTALQRHGAEQAARWRSSEPNWTEAQSVEQARRGLDSGKSVRNTRRTTCAGAASCRTAERQVADVRAWIAESTGGRSCRLVKKMELYKVLILGRYHQMRVPVADQSSRSMGMTKLSHRFLIIHLLATGSTDKTVKLWDLSNNQPSCLASMNPKALKEIRISLPWWCGARTLGAATFSLSKANPTAGDLLSVSPRPPKSCNLRYGTYHLSQGWEISSQLDKSGPSIDEMRKNGEAPFLTTELLISNLVLDPGFRCKWRAMNIASAILIEFEFAGMKLKFLQPSSGSKEGESGRSIKALLKADPLMLAAHNATVHVHSA
ncbi:hypothetical protein KSP39_PZI023920 [Platanthera zijinensis]|uniref:Uncharacterized protein n=1 Tax=Platanthera zijinensis TaxID=2320716 RepID=A0AAP0ASR5_9ASPA